MIQDRREREIQARDAAFHARPTSTAFELAKLADLHDRGAITDAEFEQRKDPGLTWRQRARRMTGPEQQQTPGPRTAHAARSGTCDRADVTPV
jgi:hypothetical protein